MNYAIVAKDPDFIICEYSLPQATDELKKKLRLRMKKAKSVNDIIRTKAGELLCVKNDIVIFACSATDSISDEKAMKFLDDLKDSFQLFYKVSLENIHKQKNLTPNCLDQPFRKKFESLFNKYNTGINMSVVNKAKAKMNELTVEVQQALKDQIESNKTSEEFVDTSNLLKNQAHKFEKQATQLEKITRTKNWWCFSCACITTFAVGIGAFVVLIIILKIFVF